MATSFEVNLVTRLRDSLMACLTPALRISDPAAVQALNDATTWLLNPDVDIDAPKPVFYFRVTVGATTYDCMTDERRRIWRLDVPTRKWVLL